jgi:cytochrome c556
MGLLRKNILLAGIRMEPEGQENRSEIEKDFLKEIRKMRQNMERGEDYGGQQCRTRMLHRWGLCS